MTNRAIILHRVGNFYGTYPAKFYFYFKVVGDFTNRNTTINLGLLLANILMNNRKWIDRFYDVGTDYIITDMAGEDSQSFRKWIRNHGSSHNSLKPYR